MHERIRPGIMRHHSNFVKYCWDMASHQALWYTFPVGIMGWAKLCCVGWEEIELRTHMYDWDEMLT